MSDTTKICTVCKFPVINHTTYDGCSRFCAVTTEEERSRWLNAKAGDKCVFPCAICGERVEGRLKQINGEYSDNICTSCRGWARIAKAYEKALNL